MSQTTLEQELETSAEPGGTGGWQPPSWPPSWQQPPAPPPTGRPTHRFLGAIAVVMVAALLGAGAGLRLGRRTSPSARTISRGSVDTNSIAATVDPSVVDINTTLGYQNARAAGTGIVLTSSGEILTNNHVVEGATSISVTDIGNGRTYNATVVGYDSSADVAVLQLSGASGLATAKIGNSANLSVGDAVAAIGNAGGTGGTPSSSSGSITALNQAITAADQGAGTDEQLSGLIQTDAPLQAGDSGGPLVNRSGQVIGMDTAGSGGFSFQSASGQGFAIPINTAMSIAHQIESGHGSATIHIGATGFLGVEIASSSQFASGSGAVVAGTPSGTPAANAGISAGDVITAVAGRTVTSPNDLSATLQQYHPGDKISITWVDQSGTQHSATVQLATGPTG